MANDQFSTISVTVGAVGMRYDFGELKQASISGFVYSDANNNGVKDVGEDVTLGAQIDNSAEFSVIGAL